MNIGSKRKGEKVRWLFASARSNFKIYKGDCHDKRKRE